MKVGVQRNANGWKTQLGNLFLFEILLILQPIYLTSRLSKNLILNWGGGFFLICNKMVF